MNTSLLDLYTDYLIASFSQTTATGLSRLVDGAVSHDQVTRLLASNNRGVIFGTKSNHLFAKFSLRMPF